MSLLLFGYFDGCGQNSDTTTLAKIRYLPVFLNGVSIVILTNDVVPLLVDPTHSRSWVEHTFLRSTTPRRSLERTHAVDVGQYPLIVVRVCGGRHRSNLGLNVGDVWQELRGERRHVRLCGGHAGGVVCLALAC